MIQYIIPIIYYHYIYHYIYNIYIYQYIYTIICTIIIPIIIPIIVQIENMHFYIHLWDYILYPLWDPLLVQLNMHFYIHLWDCQNRITRAIKCARPLYVHVLNLQSAFAFDLSTSLAIMLHCYKKISLDKRLITV